MDGTIIQQGSFTSTGNNTIISLRSDVDWMKVYNISNISGNTQFDGTEFYWQRGFPVNDGVIMFHPNNASQILAQTMASTGVGAGPIGGFTLVDTSIQTTGAAIALTNISIANPPVVTTASTAGLIDGDVIRLSNIVGAPQLAGIDFVIDVINGTTFSLENAPQIAVAGTAGFFRVIPFPSIFYPRRRVITAITNALLAEITTSVPHGYLVGQEIRFHVPAIFGMTEMDGLNGTVTEVIDTSTFEVNIDSSGFTAFTFPTAAAVPFTPAESVPFGIDTGFALQNGDDILSDATIDQSEIGIELAAGAASPAGQLGNLIFWVAGKSFSVNNQ